jgi:dTDP-4-amino-4,6-dideoxygalactose transaminase
LGYKKGDFSIAEQASQETLALPLYPEMSNAQQDHVVNTIARFMEKDKSSFL